jgi:hypothetical protein
MKPLPEIDFASIDLDTDIASAVAGLGRRAEPKFSIGENRFHVHRSKAKERAGRRGIKEFIRPENALPVLEYLPAGPDDRTHCILRGDFVLCDLIPTIIEDRGRCPHLRVATLGLSLANADALACLVERGRIGALTVVVSHYFAQVDKATVFLAVQRRLADRGKLVVTRSHAKVICLPTDAGDSFVIEGSANLRSSDNLEQMLILNDAQTLAFHERWISELAAA